MKGLFTLSILFYIFYRYLIHCTTTITHRSLVLRRLLPFRAYHLFCALWDSPYFQIQHDCCVHTNTLIFLYELIVYNKDSVIAAAVATAALIQPHHASHASKLIITNIFHFVCVYNTRIRYTMSTQTMHLYICINNRCILCALSLPFYLYTCLSFLHSCKTFSWYGINTILTWISVNVCVCVCACASTT